MVETATHVCCICNEAEIELETDTDWFDFVCADCRPIERAANGNPASNLWGADNAGAVPVRAAADSPDPVCGGLAHLCGPGGNPRPVLVFKGV